MNTQSIHDEHAAAAARQRKSSVGSLAANLGYMVRRILRPMVAAHLERQALSELSRLSPAILRDIGLTRGDIGSVAADMAKERADAWARRT